MDKYLIATELFFVMTNRKKTNISPNLMSHFTRDIEHSPPFPYNKLIEGDRMDILSFWEENKVRWQYKQHCEGMERQSLQKRQLSPE